MQNLTDSGYIPKELFSQKRSTAKDAKFDKTLMADFSRHARQPMAIILADAAYCYDRVNHVIMSLVWLVLTNRNIIHSCSYDMPSDNEVLTTDGFWRIQNVFRGSIILALYDGTRPR